MTKTVFSFLIFILFTISCKEDINIDSPERRVSANFKEIFDGFWQGMNQNYIFWDIEKPSNLWDNIYNKYKDKFYTLNINNPDDLVRGYKYLDTIVQNLSDGHLYITFNHPYLKNDTIKIAKQKDNINFITDEQLFYKNPNLYFDKHNVLYATDNNNNLRVLFATINENTLYFHCNYFFLNNSYQSNPKIRNLLDVFFSNLHENKVESLILDLRNNPGGDVSDLNFILGKIVSSPHKFGKIKYKFGNNRQDYSPYLDAFILPINNNTTFNKPIYILTNSKTSSLAELFTIALKSLPNSKVIGNTTSGITGILVTENSLYNGGSFKVGDFMNINISAASVVDLKYTSYEKTGILPDIVINNKDRFTDSQLEYLITIK